MNKMELGVSMLRESDRFYMQLAAVLHDAADTIQQCIQNNKVTDDIEDLIIAEHELDEAIDCAHGAIKTAFELQELRNKYIEKIRED